MEFQKKLNADKVLSIVCANLKFVGLWTPFNQKPSIQSLYKIYGAIFQIFFYVYFVTSLTVALVSSTTMQALSARLPMTVAQMALTPKMIPIFFFNRTIQKLRENTGNIQLLSVDEERLADIHMRFYRKVVIMLIILPQITIFFWGISSIAGTERRLIYEAWVPGFDYGNSDRDYWIIEIYLVVASAICSNYDIMIDLYYCFAMYAVSVELKLLGQRFSLMQRIQSFIFSKQLLIDHVKTLWHIRLSIEEIKSCIGVAYMLQVVMSVLCICSSINEMARTSIIENPFYFISNTVGVLGFMFQIGIVCYFGQAVFSAYHALSQQLFESNWPELIQDHDCSRTILFMMEDLKKDCVIFIGKTMPMLLTTFTSIMSLAYRLYTIMNKV